MFLKNPMSLRHRIFSTFTKEWYFAGVVIDKLPSGGVPITLRKKARKGHRCLQRGYRTIGGCYRSPNFSLAVRSPN